MLPAPPTKTGARCTSCEPERRSGARFCSACGKGIARPLPARVGEYEIAELVGEGGMGRVYRAMQPRLHRSVCIKTRCSSATACRCPPMRLPASRVG